MQTQDKRSAHQERCIGDMSKQLGKLAKAVETLCGALGPAMRDSINGTLGPQMSDLRDIAAETRRAASDLNAAAAVARTQPPPSAAYYAPQLNSPGSPLGGPVPLGVPAAPAARRDAALLATALAPEIEHIVAEAIERGMSLADDGDGSPSRGLETRRRYRETREPTTSGAARTREGRRRETRRRATRRAARAGRTRTASLIGARGHARSARRASARRERRTRTRGPARREKRPARRRPP